MNWPVDSQTCDSTPVYCGHQSLGHLFASGMVIDVDASLMKHREQSSFHGCPFLIYAISVTFSTSQPVKSNGDFKVEDPHTSSPKSSPQG